MSEKQIIIFSDLDGTLLDHHNYSFAAAMQMLETLKNLNIPVVLNTSKTFNEVSSIQQQLAINAPFVVENGAAIYFPEDYFSATDSVLDQLDSYQNLLCKRFSRSREYWLDLLRREAESFQGMFLGFSQMTIDDIVTHTGLTQQEAEMAAERQFTEPLKWLGNDNQREAFCQHMRSLGATLLAGGRFLHVGDDCDKGKAMTWLCDQLTQQNSTKEIISIALGDSGNDIAMLEKADYAVVIKSPKDDHLTLTRKTNLLMSEQFGPAGWSECLAKIIPNYYPEFERLFHG